MKFGTNDDNSPVHVGGIIRDSFKGFIVGWKIRAIRETRIKHIDYICDGDNNFDFDSFSIKLIIKWDGTIS